MSTQPEAVTTPHGAPETDVILRVQDLKKHFPMGQNFVEKLRRDRERIVRAVDGVSFDLHRGEALGLVGESGCGKSTTGRTIVRLLDPTEGTIEFEGRDISSLTRKELRPVRRDMQILFQDPFASLNPRMTVQQIISEPLRVHGIYQSSGGHSRVMELLELVGLKPDHARRYPHEFSGGQRQRVGIARSLALDPKLLVLDEPVSALDVSIQAQILKLLKDLQERLGLSYLFIAHDLSVIRNMCDRVAVMYLGKVAEVAETMELFNYPSHPYTQALMSAVPRTDRAGKGRGDRIVLEGDVPSPANPPSGCRFRTRCWRADDKCAEQVPALEERITPGHEVACHYAEPGRVL